MSHAWLRLLGMFALTAAGCARAAAARPVDAGQTGGSISERDAGSLEDAMAGLDPFDGGDGSGDGSGDGEGDGTGSGSSDAGDIPSGGGDAGASHDAGMPASCPAKNTCETALVLAPIAGDVGTPVATAMGTGSQFLEVEILDTGGTRNASKTLKAHLALVSPAGANYDLFVHRANAGGHASAPRDCIANEQSSQFTIGDDLVDVSWPDIQPNAIQDTAGDGLILSIEVRHIDGVCTGSWALTVTGNAP